MTAVAELLGQAQADRLAALKAELGKPERQEAANPKPGNLNPGPPVCGACGQRLPAPAAVFRSGAEQDLAADTSRQRAAHDAYARA
jgi:hypothetical protein